MSRITRDIAELFPPAHPRLRTFPGRWPSFVGWVPLLVLSVIVCIYKNSLAPWIFMWALAFAMFFGCKWLTWCRCQKMETPCWRHCAYLLAWPGMDAKAFLDAKRNVPKPQAREWFVAIFKTLLGGLLVWRVVRLAPGPLLAGWVGLIGVVFLLHFGAFHLLALMWQQLGVDAQPIMRAPILAKTLAEFWGERWNSAFNLLIHDLLFRKLFRRTGAIGATLAVFLASGIIHDLLLSVPAGAGYGLPTAYFLLQGGGLWLERQKWGPRENWTGRCFTVAVTALPAFWLFHPPFIRNVILPMLHAIGAT